MIKIKSIDFLSSIEDIDDIFDDNMDVSVDLENGRNYVVVIGTPKNLLKLMENEKSNFLSPGDPIIIVKKMTKEVVEEAIKAYVDDDDAYYLKFYAAELDIKTLNVLKDRYIVRDKFLDDLLEKGESIDIENYNLIDFNIDNL
jgi:hypothetical protein